MDPEPAFSRRHKNLCRPYGARFRYKTLTQGFRPRLRLCRPPGWICQNIQCIVITACVAAGSPTLSPGLAKGGSKPVPSPGDSDF